MRSRHHTDEEATLQANSTSQSPKLNTTGVFRRNKQLNSSINASISRESTSVEKTDGEFRVSKKNFHQAFKAPSLPTSLSQSPKRAFKDIYELQKD